MSEEASYRSLIQAIPFTGHTLYHAEFTLTVFVNQVAYIRGISLIRYIRVKMLL